jgi:hypothetical protein
MEKNSVTIIDKVIAGLKNAAIELEEFHLKVALGKAEAIDAYEKTKKDFSAFLFDTKLYIDSAKNNANEKSLQLRAIIEKIDLQLALGKADTKDLFEQQSEKISNAFNEFETFILKNETINEFYTDLHTEIEKFKIKLEILKLHFELNKLNTLDSFEEKKRSVLKKIVDVEKRLLERYEQAENKWSHFKEEISEAYVHLKKAFVG